MNLSDGRKLSNAILIGLVSGAMVGLAINLFAASDGLLQQILVDNLFDGIGDLFVNSLQMLVVPLVLVSLVCGTASLSDPKQLGRVGGKAIVFYLFTTSIAITSALVFATLFAPGVGMDVGNADFAANEAPAIKDVLTGIIPKNPVGAMAEGNMLAVIFFAILLGISVALSGRAGARAAAIFNDFNTVIMTLVKIIMWIAPVGVFALIAKLVAQLGWSAFDDLLGYFFLVLALLIAHLFLTYGLLLQVLARINPLKFFTKMRAAMLFAFSTASSNATMPVTLRTVEDRMGVDKSVGSFIVPLGATINMDGTAIMQGVATVFIANAYNVELSMVQLLTVVLMATMASIGAAGVPGVGLILLATVLVQVGLPVEGIGLILGIDRLLDMARTAVNITGDATVSVIVARSEDQLDESVLYDPDAGEIDEIEDLKTHDEGTAAS